MSGEREPRKLKRDAAGGVTGVPRVRPKKIPDAEGPEKRQRKAVCSCCRNLRSRNVFTSPICFSCGQVFVPGFFYLLIACTVTVFVVTWGLSSVRWHLVEKPKVKAELTSIVKDAIPPRVVPKGESDFDLQKELEGIRKMGRDSRGEN